MNEIDKYNPPAPKKLEYLKVRYNTDPSQLSFEKAQQLQETGHTREARDHYVLLTLNNDNADLRLKALLGEADMDVNLGRFDQAQSLLDSNYWWKETLGKAEDQTLRTMERDLVRVSLLEKVGRFTEAIHLIDDIGLKLNKAKSANLESLEDRLFDLRLKVGLAVGACTQDRKWISGMIESLKGQTMAHAEKRELGMPQYKQEGDAFLWLAQAHHLFNKNQEAGVFLSKSKSSYDKYLTSNGINEKLLQIAPEIVSARISLCRGLVHPAFDSYRLAHQLAVSTEDNPLAAAEAGLGLAKVYACTKEFDLACEWKEYALTLYPQQLDRPFTG